MPRTFNGTTAVVTFNGGGTTAATGPITWAAIIRRTSGTNNDGIAGCETSGGTTRDEFFINNTGDMSGRADQIRYYNGSASQGAITITVADGWCLAAVTKSSGTTTPRFHKYQYSNNTHTHTNGGGTLANRTAPGAGGKVTIGEADGDWTTGDIAIVGMWDRELSDAEIENLPFTLQVWYASAPAGLWLFDQSATTQNVNDLTGGGATQSAITSTSVATTSLPVFGYGDDADWVIRPQGGGGGAPALRRYSLSLTGVG